jgi:sugar/nucleoside kinase (ribokinase family)
MVTRGKLGTLLYRAGDGFYECPALSIKVVDRIGAGDSVLAITSLCEAKGLPPEVTGFVANLVGAQAVTIVGNRSAIDRVQVLKGIEAVLK